MSTYRWIESEVPKDLEVRQVWGFIFDRAGQILMFEDGGKFNLPGGGPENEESIFETLIREAEEEVQVSIKSIEYLGYQFVEDPEEFAQVRLVCQLDEIFPSKADPITGRTYSRLWVPASQTNALLNWGDSGDRQIESAIARASRWFS